jgi:hypothetical protein
MTMHARLFGSVLAIGVLLLLPNPAAAKGSTKTQLAGVWKVTSLVVREVETGATRNTFGEKPVGHAVFTRGGRFLWGWVSDGRKAPAGPVPNDAERGALYNTLAFGSGSFRVEGDAVFLRYESSWNQSWTGTERRAEMQVTGKTLVWKSLPFKPLDGDRDVVAITTLERVE